MKVRSQAKPLAGPINALSWSPDGSRVLAGGFNEAAILDDRLVMKERIALPHEGQIWGAAWSVDGGRIALASEAGLTLRLAGGGPLRRLVARSALAASFSPTAADMLAAAFADGSSIFIDLSRADPTPIALDAGGASLVAIAWSPDGRRIATGGLDATVHVWDVSTKTEVAKVDDVGRLDINGLAWSPDSHLLAAATQVGDIVLFDVNHWQLAHVLSGARGWSRSITFDRAGDLLAGAGEDGVVRVWRVSDWSLAAIATATQDSVWSLAWSPIADLLASAGGRYQSRQGDTAIRSWGVSE
jgi:WD40 repeat protein